MLKFKFLALALISSSFMMGCSTSGSNTTAAANHAGEHTFACSMHPEVVGKEGDICKKCGMKLEHNDNAGAANSNKYFMQFGTSPATVSPGDDVVLSMTPKMEGHEGDAVGLEIQHEKKIHLIIVNDDLSYFDHIHPEYTEDGSYTVPTKFPAPGNYTVFADFKPVGGNHTVDKMKVAVKGNAPEQKKYSGNKLTSNSEDGFSVTLEPQGVLTANQQTSIIGTVMQNGKVVDPNALEDFLGAKAHMVVVSLNDKEYLHVHPGVEDGKFDLHTTFEKAGVYRGWIQFQSKGKVHTTDFVLNVQAGQGGAPADSHTHH